MPVFPEMEKLWEPALPSLRNRAWRAMLFHFKHQEGTEGGARVLEGGHMCSREQGCGVFSSARFLLESLWKKDGSMGLGHLGGEGELMNMVKSPENNVQPADLDFAVCLVACQLFNLEEKFLLNGLLPPSGGNSSMLNHGKISNMMRF